MSERTSFVLHERLPLHEGRSLVLHEVLPLHKRRSLWLSHEVLSLHEGRSLDAVYKLLSSYERVSLGISIAHHWVHIFCQIFNIKYIFITKYVAFWIVSKSLFKLRHSKPWIIEQQVDPTWERKNNLEFRSILVTHVRSFYLDLGSYIILSSVKYCKRKFCIHYLQYHQKIFVLYSVTFYTKFLS